MLNHYKFTYIIPYNHKKDKLKILKKTISWLIGFSNIEIILVENGKVPKLRHINLPVKYIFVKSNGTYNKSHAINVAAKLSSTDRFIIGAYNLITNSENLISCIKQLDNYDIIYPINKIAFCTKEQVNMSINDLLCINSDTFNEDILGDNIILYRRDSFFNLGGYSEEFNGSSNKFQELKIEKMNLNCKIVDGVGYILSDIDVMTEEISAIKVINEFRNYNKEKVTSYINGIKKTMARINKYE